MKLTPPSKLAFWISVVLAVLGVLGNFGVLSFISAGLAFWLVVVGFVVLLVGLLVKGF